MQPKKPESETIRQDHLFRARLDQQLNREHALFVLAGKIDWDRFDRKFGELYSDQGRPGVPTRLMVGLHYLKHMYDESDESVVERWVENPYWQYFCGFEYLQHELPIDPSSMTRWRNRIGAKRMKMLLKVTIETAKKLGLLKHHHASRVNVDTTVQEKAIAFPTDQRLYQKARVKLVKEAKKRGIRLRQSYTRLGRRAFSKHGRYAHARQWKRARKMTRKLKTYLGRVIRDIERKCPKPDVDLEVLLEISKAIYEQKRDDTNKVYSLHALEVECISKGKAHKRYEFGCKVAAVSTSTSNWVLDVEALDGNPYDGHTLKGSLDNAEENSGFKVKESYCDKGYRGGAKDVPGVDVYLSGSRRLTRAKRKRLKRRQAIEPIIGHMKTDNRMGRNFLKGIEGDKNNAVLAGCGFNMRKLYRAVARFVRELLLGWIAEIGRNGVRQLTTSAAA
jgi:IS5 family transposase